MPACWIFWMMWITCSCSISRLVSAMPIGGLQATREVSLRIMPGDPAIAALGERYQLPFAQPDWLPDVIARYHLTPMTR